MQIAARINSKQLDRIIRVLKSIPAKEGKKIIRKAAREAARQVLLPAAKAATPVDTGDLRRSLKVRAISRSKNGVGVRVGVNTKDVFYGVFQELGWRVGKRSKSIRDFQEATRKTERSVVRRAEIYANNVNDTRRLVPGKRFLQKTAEQKGEQAATVAAYKIGKALLDFAKK